MVKSPSMEMIPIPVTAVELPSTLSPLVIIHATITAVLVKGPRYHFLNDKLSPLVTSSSLIPEQLRVMGWPRAPVTAAVQIIKHVASWIMHENWHLFYRMDLFPRIDLIYFSFVLTNMTMRHTSDDIQLNGLGLQSCKTASIKSRVIPS